MDFLSNNPKNPFCVVFLGSPFKSHEYFSCFILNSLCVHSSNNDRSKRQLSSTIQLWKLRAAGSRYKI